MRRSKLASAKSNTGPLPPGTSPYAYGNNDDAYPSGTAGLQQTTGSTLQHTAAPVIDPETTPYWAINPLRYCHQGRIWCLSSFLQTRWWYETDGYLYFVECERPGTTPTQKFPPMLKHVAPAIDDAVADANAAAALDLQAVAARAHAAHVSGQATDAASQAHSSATTAAQEMCLLVHHQDWLLSTFAGCPRSPPSRSAPRPNGSNLIARRPSRILPRVLHMFPNWGSYVGWGVCQVPIPTEKPPTALAPHRA